MLGKTRNIRYIIDNQSVSMQQNLQQDRNSPATFFSGRALG